MVPLEKLEKKKSEAEIGIGRRAGAVIEGKGKSCVRISPSNP